MPTPEERIETMTANLHRTTGRDLQEWVAVVRATGLGKHKEILEHLKSQLGLTHGYANLIALRALAGDAAPPAAGEDPAAGLFDGAKAGLRPIYDAVMSLVHGFGDVAVSPKKTYVSLRSKKQFALIQPSTATRLDVGINLKGAQPTPRLELSGSFNSMVTHRVRLERTEQVDAELGGWLKQAYDEASR